MCRRQKRTYRFQSLKESENATWGVPQVAFFYVFSSRRRHTIWAYLWDLVDDGLEETVEFCKGEMGLDAISVATAYHTFQQLRPGRPGAKLLTAGEAAVYFRPQPELYVDTCIRPHVAPLVGEGNPMGELANICQKNDLGLISWTVCLHNSYLAGKYPDCAQQTAYGDSLGWVLCPGVDDVRAYIIALCRDLAENYGVERLELEMCNFGGYGHAHHHVKDGVDLGGVGRYLFGLSFSAGCMDKARGWGIDAEGLRNWVREQLDPVFSSGEPLTGEIEEVVAGNAELAAFQEMREELVTSLIGEIKGATGVEVSFLLMGDRWGARIRPERMAGEADLVELLAYSRDPEAIAERVKGVLKDIDDPEQLVLGLQAYYPCANSADDLRANVECGLELGVRQFSYYNYGIAPKPCLEWIGNCIKNSKIK